MRIQPDEGIALRFATKVPGQATILRDVAMDFRYGAAFGSNTPEAYERLLLDAMRGDATLFTRARRGRGAVGVHRPVFDAWRARRAPPPPTTPPALGPGAGRRPARARRAALEEAVSGGGASGLIARLEKELRDALERRPKTRRRPPLSRVCTMNLEVVARSTRAARALHARRRRGDREHPGARDPRVASSPTRTTTSSTGSATAVCSLEGGRKICSERITLSTPRERVARASASAIEAFLVPEIPTALVWLGRVHVDDPVFEDLAERRAPHHPRQRVHVARERSSRSPRGRGQQAQRARRSSTSRGRASRPGRR